MYDIIAVADLCFDMIVSGPPPEFNQVELLADDYMVDLGGSVGIFACQYAKLGGNIALLGTVGNDMAGKLILDRLQQSGVDTKMIAVTNSLKTGMGLNLSSRGDRAMLAYLGTMDDNKPDVLKDDLLQKTKHWHIASYFLLQHMRDAWESWIQKLKSNNITVSLDSNWDPLNEWENIKSLLPLVDVFLPNEAEALAISGEKDLVKAGLFLAKLCPLVVIKTGEKGAVVFRKDNYVAYPVPEELTKELHIADTTGAGDNFDAGFVHAWLSDLSEYDCVQQGFICAVSSLKELGGIKGQVVKNQ
ncbi:MAG: carbohydrate kinase family protein [Chitinophagaceae bacterium]|nr:carbohydrate kinase family protein [Chitinophagaceae bacterium]MCW5928409.1 carbohydrate kinase family protein [Chitinophagaceae bacterium]